MLLMLVFCNGPAQVAPNFSLLFKLEVDASSIGAETVLLQEGEDDLSYPVCYYSVIYKRHQLNYSTIKKETLLALQHFEVYVGSSPTPATVYCTPTITLSSFCPKCTTSTSD